MALTFWKGNEQDAIVLYLEEESGCYAIHQTIKTQNLDLEEVIRNSISLFNITTVVEHPSSDSTMIYDYKNGVIQKIIERTSNQEKIIYHYPSELIFKEKIEDIKEEINRLLDKRNNVVDLQEIPNIDQRLKTLSRKIKEQNDC